MFKICGKTRGKNAENVMKDKRCECSNFDLESRMDSHQMMKGCIFELIAHNQYLLTLCLSWWIVFAPRWIANASLIFLFVRYFPSAPHGFQEMACLLLNICFVLLWISHCSPYLHGLGGILLSFSVFSLSTQCELSGSPCPPVCTPLLVVCFCW